MKSLVLLGILSYLTIACTMDDSFLLELEKEKIESSIPAKPNSVLLSSPLQSIDSESSPSFLVSEISSGDFASIYKDPECTNLIGIAKAEASSVTVNTTIPLSEPGLYSIYARATSPYGKNSPCSSVSASYGFTHSNWLLFDGSNNSGHNDLTSMTNTSSFGDLAIIKQNSFASLYRKSNDGQTGLNISIYEPDTGKIKNKGELVIANLNASSTAHRSTTKASDGLLVAGLKDDRGGGTLSLVSFDGAFNLNLEDTYQTPEVDTYTTHEVVGLEDNKVLHAYYKGAAKDLLMIKIHTIDPVAKSFTSGSMLSTSYNVSINSKGKALGYGINSSIHSAHLGNKKVILAYCGQDSGSINAIIVDASSGLKLGAVSEVANVGKNQIGTQLDNCQGSVGVKRIDKDRALLTWGDQDPSLSGNSGSLWAVVVKTDGLKLSFGAAKKIVEVYGSNKELDLAEYWTDASAVIDGFMGVIKYSGLEMDSITRNTFVKTFKISNLDISDVSNPVSLGGDYHYNSLGVIDSNKIISLENGDNFGYHLLQNNP